MSTVMLRLKIGVNFRLHRFRDNTYLQLGQKEARSPSNNR
jgi:hypothetical protein